MQRLYPESKVELTPLSAKFYDSILNLMSLGLYENFITRAINDCKFKYNDSILDFGAGTGKNAFLMLRYLGKDGKITGVDISDVMKQHFENKMSKFPNVAFLQKRIDEPLNLNEKFDNVFISFVLHGFPNDVRSKIIDNAYSSLKKGGRFVILDFAEFSLEEMPPYYRIPFKYIECKYAFDFIKRDWKSILSDFEFGNFSEKFYLKNYVRLLIGEKL